MKTKIISSVFPPILDKRRPPKKAMSCRLTLEAIDLIEQVAKKNAVSQSVVIENCIRHALSPKSKEKQSA